MNYEGLAYDILKKICLDIVDSISKTEFFSKRDEKSRKYFEKTLYNHMEYCRDWCDQIQEYVLPPVKNINDGTISLSINKIPRKLRPKYSNPKTINELELMKSEKCFLILGDPGSGKTTTIKRLIKSFFEESDLENYFNYPILIQAHEIKVDVYTHIADLLGFKYDRIHEKIHQIDGKVEHYQYSIDGKYLRDFIIDFLRETKCCVFIDGIDECNPSIYNNLVGDIDKLSRLRSNNYNIIASCRSGYYRHPIGNLLTVEISPLSKLDQEAIISKHLKEPEEFLSKISNYAFSELLDRPLFLTYIIMIFIVEGQVPKQPSDIYRHILDYALKGWDRDRGRERHTKYSNFTPDKKSDFLSCFSYILLIEKNQMSFDDQELFVIYDDLRHHFDLPKEEAEDVVGEIETHAGIIIKKSIHSYEFSHPSMLEYLCAIYIAEENRRYKLSNYIRSRPGIMALAIARAKNSNNLMVSLLENTKFSQWSDRFGIFFSRLKLEAPSFFPENILGYFVFDLLLQVNNIQSDNENYSKDGEKFNSIMSIQGFKNSLIEFFAQCKYTSINYDEEGLFSNYTLYLTFDSYIDHPVAQSLNREIGIPRRLVELFSQDKSLKFRLRLGYDGEQHEYETFHQIASDNT